MTAEPETILIEVRHRYAASPERVFDAWLDVERARQWMFTTGPGTNVVAEVDPRPGGAFRFTDRRPEGDMEHVGEYVEIDRPRRLVFRFGVPSISPDMDLVTLDLAPLPDGGCELTLRHEMSPEWAEYADGSRQAWGRMLEGVERSLAEGGQHQPTCDA